MAATPVQAVGSVKDGGLSFQQMKEGIVKVGRSLKSVGEEVKETLVDPVKEFADKVRQGCDVYNDAAKAVQEIQSQFADGNWAAVAKTFDGDWDKLSKDFDTFYSSLTGTAQQGVLEAFAKDNFGEVLFSAGSIVKQETPKVLGGVDDLLSCLSLKDNLSSNPLTAVGQIRDALDKAVRASQTINTAMGTVFNRVTTEMGIDASALTNLQQQLNGVISQATGLIPNEIKMAYAGLGDALDVYSSGKMLVTSLVSGFDGGMSLANLSKLASTFNTGWDSFAKETNSLFNILSGGQQANILESFAKSAFGETVFQAGGAIKQNMPGILGGIASFKSSLDAFKGSYRDPVAAARKIKAGVDGIINSTSRIAGSLQNIAGRFFKDPAGNAIKIPVLDELARLNKLKPVKLLDNTMRVLGGGTAVVANAGNLLDAVKKGDWKSAVDIGKKTADQVKSLTKSGLKSVPKASAQAPEAGLQPQARQAVSSPGLTKSASTEEGEEENEDKKQPEKDRPSSSPVGDTYVVSTATMKCTFGTGSSKLMVYPDRTVFMTGKPMGNISDHVSMYNILPFGRCRTVSFPPTGSATAAAHGRLTPMPCIPGTVSPWMNGKRDVLIKGQPALMKTCYCQCKWGGIITLQNDGQGGTGCMDVVKQPREKIAGGGASKRKRIGPDRPFPARSVQSVDIREGATGSVSLAGMKPSQPSQGTVSLAGMKPVQYKNSVSLADVKRLQDLVKEMPASWTEEQRKAKAQNILDLEKALGITKGNPMTVEEADRQSANPNYSEGHEFRVNCATCAAAYALRLLGFDVKAKGNVSDSDSLNEWLSFGHSFDIWNNADGTPAKPVYTAEWMAAQGEEKMTPELYKRYFEETCKEEGVYIVTIGWSGGGGHATILQRDSDGELYYIEPQLYDEKAGERLGTDNLYNHLSDTPLSTRGILRVDDKLFNTDYAELFEI